MRIQLQFTVAFKTKIFLATMTSHFLTFEIIFVSKLSSKNRGIKCSRFEIELCCVSVLHCFSTAIFRSGMDYRGLRI